MRTLGKTSLFLLCMSVIIFGFVSSSPAQIKPGSISITPQLGWYMFDSSEKLDNDLLLGLSLRSHFTENWSFESALGYVKTDREDINLEVKTYLSSFNLNYHFKDYNNFVPYITGGFGTKVTNPKVGRGDISLALSYGVGADYFIRENISIRGEVRHFHIPEHSDNNFLATLGLSFFFGGAKAAPPPPPPAPPAPPKDSDGDGVPDHLDKCPDTPPGVKVDQYGCPLDSDGDGVPDYLDKCPGTPADAKVDARGCWVLEGVHFDFDKSDIKPQYRHILDEAASVLKKNPGLKIEIRGHTDSTGTRAYNQKLSEARAKSVLEYFVSKGVNRANLSAKGYGQDNPAETNETKEGRYKNRRVELKPLI